MPNCHQKPHKERIHRFLVLEFIGLYILNQTMDCCTGGRVPRDLALTNLCAKNAAVCDLQVNNILVNRITTIGGLANALGLIPGSNVTFEEGSLIINSASNGPWSVDIQGTANFINIQSAIDAAVQVASATNPQTVFIYPGVYQENLTLYPFVHLTGLNGSSGSLTSPLPLSGSVLVQGSATTNLVDTDITSIVQIDNLHLNSPAGVTLYVRGGIVTVTNTVISADSGIAIVVDSGSTSPGPVLSLQTSQVVAGVSGAVAGQTIVAGNDGAIAGPVVNIAYCTLQPNTTADTVLIQGNTQFLAEYSDILGNLISSALCNGGIQLRYCNVVGAGKISVNISGAATTLTMDSCTLNTVNTVLDFLNNAGTARISDLNIPAGSSVRIANTGTMTQGTLLNNHYILPTLSINTGAAIVLTERQSNLCVLANPSTDHITLTLPTSPPVGFRIQVTRTAISAFNVVLEAPVGFTINGRSIQPGVPPVLATLSAVTITNPSGTGVVGDSVAVTFAGGSLYTIDGVASNWT